MAGVMSAAAHVCPILLNGFNRCAISVQRLLFLYPVVATARTLLIPLVFHSAVLWTVRLSTGTIRVYDDKFDLVADITLAARGKPIFVNDVTVPKTAAYFTDSLQPQIYQVFGGV